MQFVIWKRQMCDSKKMKIKIWRKRRDKVEGILRRTVR